MRVVGFDTMDFINASNQSIAGYTCGLPADWTPVPTTQPTVLTRPGTYGTFGVGSVSELLIPGKFHYNTAFGLTYEAAWLNLFKRLDPINQNPRELRVRRNDGVLIKIQAVVQPLAFSSGREINFRDVNWIAAAPIWLSVGYLTGTGGFS